MSIQKSLITILFIMVLILFWLLQNPINVPIHFIFFKTSFAFHQLVFFVLFLGATLGILLIAPIIRQRNRKIDSLLERIEGMREAERSLTEKEISKELKNTSDENHR